jgi:diacylglycerol kinase (ATP)
VPPLQVIANPNAQSGRGARILPALEKALSARSAGAEFHLTRAPGHARELARDLALRKGADVASPTVAVVGGDGTLHEVVNGLRDAGFPAGVSLALLPVGTGNDFHRILRAGTGLKDFLHLLDHGVSRRIDVGEVRWADGEAAFINLLGVGIDVAVLRRRTAFSRLPGLFQYGAALFSALRRFEPVALEVELDPAASRGAIRSPALLAAVTVGPSIGGGFQLSPSALADDGRLDLFFAEPLNILEVMTHLPGVIRGTLGTTDRIHRATFTSARFASPDQRPFAFELDGELMPDETPWLETWIVPGALNVLDRA